MEILEECDRTTKEQPNPCNKVVTILSADTTQWRDRIEMRAIVIRHSERIVEMVVSRGSLKFQQKSFYMNIHPTFQPAAVKLWQM